MATAATLNPEPSLPAERKEQQLGSKSDATEVNLDQYVDYYALNDSVNPGFYAGQGEDAAPRSPRRNMHKKPGSPRMNGYSKEKKPSNVMVEDFGDRDGEHLTSLRPGWHRERNGSSASRRKKRELVSGRKAGARWEQSQ